MRTREDQRMRPAPRPPRTDLRTILGATNQRPTRLEREVSSQQACQVQEAGTRRTVPPLSRRDRASRLRRLLGRDAPSYAARANLTEQLDTLKRDHCLLMNKVERCRRLRDDARQEP